MLIYRCWRKHNHVLNPTNLIALVVPLPVVEHILGQAAILHTEVVEGEDNLLRRMEIELEDNLRLHKEVVDNLFR